MLVLLSWSRKAIGESFPRKQPPFGAQGQCERGCALNTQGCLRVWAFVPGLHHARFAHACFDVNSSSWWCMVVLVWGGGEREEYGKMGAPFSHTTPLTTRRKMQYLVHSGSPLTAPRTVPSVFSVVAFKRGPEIHKWTPVHNEGWLESKEGNLTS